MPLFMTPARSLSSLSFFLFAQLRSPLKFSPSWTGVQEWGPGGETEKDGGAL